MSLSERLVRRVWASQNDSPPVREALEELLGGLGPGHRALNVGAGDTSLHTRMINVDLRRAPTTDCLADALWLPFEPETFDLLISQETVEHVRDPFRAVGEMERVLRPEGRLYLQVPFIIGYHPGPEDYWRFTRAGVRRLLEIAGLRCERLTATVGAGTGLHRILVEFAAGLAARLIPGSYRTIKGLAALLFYPLKWFDRWMMGGAQADRIVGGYFAIGRK